MKTFYNKTELSSYLKTIGCHQNQLGFVPTMGALHHGHLSLIHQALRENDAVVVSIFVNPTQFNNKEDLETYPKDLERDIALLRHVSASKLILYAPEVTDIYETAVNAETFDFDGLEHEMEGAYRPGHFDGVGTIVKRLFEIVKPHNAYFGEKDFQQLRIIQKLVEKHQLPITIVGCPIYRHADGLAYSSRNKKLKPNFRAAAPFIYDILKTAKEKFGTERASSIEEWVKQQFDAHTLLELEYFFIADTDTLKPATEELQKKNNTYRAFIAVYADTVRLIDNIALN